MLFEWGSLRKKNADSAMGKHLMVFILSALSVFSAGFGLAFGEAQMLGTRYFFSLKMLKDEDNPENTEELALEYVIMILSVSIISSLAISSMSERNTKRS